SGAFPWRNFPSGEPPDFIMQASVFSRKTLVFGVYAMIKFGAARRTKNEREEPREICNRHAGRVRLSARRLCQRAGEACADARARRQARAASCARRHADAGTRAQARGE